MHIGSRTENLPVLEPHTAEAVDVDEAQKRRGKLFVALNL